MTPLRLNKIIFKSGWSLVVGSLLALTVEARSETDLQFFSQPDMDFWKKPESAPRSKPLPASGSAPSKPGGKDSSFSWKKYLDPKNDEFFREGEYLPPAPFMEIARDPSDENIDHWFKYLEAKNEITRNLQAKLTEYAAKHPAESPSLGAAPVAPSRLPEPISIREDARRFRLRLYFDSKCPHCERMIETLKSLAQRGYSIELRQLDSDTQARSRIPFPVSAATAEELKQYKIQSVPVLLVGDLKARTYFSIQGYQTEESVLKVLSDSSQLKKDGGSL